MKFSNMRVIFLLLTGQSFSNVYGMIEDVAKETFTHPLQQLLPVPDEDLVVVEDDFERKHLFGIETFQETDKDLVVDGDDLENKSLFGTEKP